MDGGREGGKEGGTFLLLLKPKSDGWMDGWTGEEGEETSAPVVNAGELRSTLEVWKKKS